MFLTLFKSLVHQHLEYATAIWAPIYAKMPSKQRASRLISLSYPERLKTLGLPSLEYRRDRADMIQVCTILNGIDKVDQGG